MIDQHPRDPGLAALPTSFGFLYCVSLFVTCAWLAIASLGQVSAAESGTQSPAAADALATFAIKEHFGVDHPDQIIDFDLPMKTLPAGVTMAGPDGTPVLFQVLENKRVAVRTDLPAGASRSWKLMRNKPGVAQERLPGEITVRQVGQVVEFSNGLTGFRAPVGAWRIADVSKIPSPIQGVRLRDGKWAAKETSFLKVEATRLRSMTGKILENGPLAAIVQITYEFDRPEYRYGDQRVAPAGVGFYRSTITLQAGQPSLLFVEEADVDVSYSIRLSDELTATHARYRGHHASRKEYGQGPDGNVYKASHERGGSDAQVALRFDKVYPSSYVTGENSWARMAIWNPWITDSGWYWQLYDEKAGDDANIAGIFAGPASIALGAHVSGVGIFTGPPDPKTRRNTIGLTVSSYRRGPDASVAPRSRFGWGLFTGKKGEDLKAPDKVQPIAQQLNLHGGFNLNKLHRYQLDFAAPPQRFGKLYMDAATVKRLTTRVKDDQPFFKYLYDAEPTSRDLLDYWRNDSDERREKVVQEIAGLATRMLQAFVHGDGIYDFHFHYWHGGLEMMRKGVWIDALLGSGQLSPAQEAKVKEAAVLFSNVLWDDDFVPLSVAAGVNLGTANMPVQQVGYRHFYALMLNFHPTMASRAASVRQHALSTLNHIVNEHGSPMGSAHYTGASFGPTFNTLVQMKHAGIEDAFKSQPRLARFAEFLMHLHTPPEPRFGGLRKLVAIGDGSTESTELTGQLAAAYRGIDPSLSARLMQVWQEGGKLHSGFFGTSILKIDHDAPAASAKLGDASFPGWCTVLRHGWGTPDETAAWLVNGDFYRDHRHHDHGSLVIYALGAPLSVDWGSLYQPQSAGGYMHSVVLPESSLGRPWDQDGPPAGVGGYGVWHGSKEQSFLSFPALSLSSSSYQGKDLEWTRTVYSCRALVDRPLLIVRDRFSGSAAKQSKVMTLNLMASGPVETPKGRVEPPARYHDGSDKGEWPSAVALGDLAPGTHRFNFKGQWRIDWNLHVVASSPQAALLGNWAHGWHPGGEQAQFRQSNNRPFEERQHIFRLRGSDDFLVVIEPYLKETNRDSTAVTQEKGHLRVRGGDFDAMLTDSYCILTAGSVKVLSSFGTKAVQAEELSIQGGPAEIQMAEGTTSLSCHGKPGVRIFRLPGNWKLADSSNKTGAIKSDRTGRHTVDYGGGLPLTIRLVRQAN